MATDADQELDNTNQQFSNSIDRLKESFLLATAQGGNAEDCEALLSIGADVNWRGADDETPLLAACKKGHGDAAQVMLAYGADCNARGGDSLTALHVAARRGDLASVNLLLNNAANMNLKTADGKTAFDIAKAKGYEDVCQRIIMHRHNSSVAGQSAPSNPDPQAKSSSNNSSSNNSSSNNSSGRAGSSGGQRGAEQKPSSSAGSSLTMEAAAKQAEERGGMGLRPSSKAQDKRDGVGAVGGVSPNLRMPGQPQPQRAAGPTTAAPKDYSFAPPITAAMSGEDAAASASRSAGGTRGGPPAGVDHTNYIYELQAALDAKANEAEVLRVQLEEELISGHVAEKENLALKEALLDLKEQLLEGQEELALLRGDPEGLRELSTVGECDKVERYLKASLQRVEEHKLGLINKMVESNLQGMVRPVRVADAVCCVLCAPCLICLVASKLTPSPPPPPRTGGEPHVRGVPGQRKVRRAAALPARLSVQGVRQQRQHD